MDTIKTKTFDNKHLLPGMEWDICGAYITLKDKPFYLEGGEELTYDQEDNLISITIKTTK